MVVEVHAIDGDIGPNGAVRYRLKQDVTGNWRTFTIDSTSGIIKLKHPLDREKQKIYDVRMIPHFHSQEFMCIQNNILIL